MSFYITLPSNGSFSVYPNNTVSNFTNLLQSTIELSSNWEVALVRFTYRNSIESVFGYINLKDDKETLKIPIHVNEAETFVQTIENLQKDIDDVKSEFHKVKGFFEVNNEKEIMKLTIKPVSGHDFTLGGNLPYIFNLDVQKKYTPDDPLVLVYDNKPILNADSLWIYTDIIHDQFVGDVKVPLLDNIALAGIEKNQTKTVEIKNPIYVRLKKTMISTINIAIKDSLGEPIHFTNLAKVIVKLHFRPLKNE